MSGIGAPAGAYPYGLLITINPTHSTVVIYSTSQIYITDNPSSSSDGRGIFVRTNNRNKWLKINGTEINAVSK